MPLPIFGLLMVAFQDRAVSPEYCPALNRPLAWDPKGMYALDSDRPLTKGSRQLVAYLQDAELGKAEALAKHLLQSDEDDFVPAWVLSQVVRVKRRALNEYLATFKPKPPEGLSAPRLLYLLHICRLADEELPIESRGSGRPLYDRILRDEKLLRDQLTSAAEKHLGVVVGLSNVSLFWSPISRTLLEAYQRNHPKGPDIRGLICQAYVTGMHSGPPETAFTSKAISLEEPRPEKALGVAMAILKDRPNDPIGHYYAGVAHFELRHVDLALKEFKAALATGNLPNALERGARAFIAKPSFPSLRPKVDY